MTLRVGGKIINMGEMVIGEDVIKKGNVTEVVKKKIKELKKNIKRT